MTIGQLKTHIEKIIIDAEKDRSKLFDKHLTDELNDEGYDKYQQLCGAVKALEALKEVLNG